LRPEGAVTLVGGLAVLVVDSATEIPEGVMMAGISADSSDH
jgi:hypothetical protein